MNCHEFEALLPERFERQALPDKAVAHMAECSACRCRGEEWQIVNNSVQAWKRSLPAVDFRERVLHQWKQSPHVIPLSSSAVPEIPARPAAGRVHGERGMLRRSALRELATAACVVLLAGWLLYRGTTSQQIVATHSPPEGGVARISGAHTPLIATTATHGQAAQPRLNAQLLLRETKSALSGAVHALLPTSLIADAASKPSLGQGNSKSATPNASLREEDELSLGQQLQETLEDLWLPVDPSEAS